MIQMIEMTGGDEPGQGGDVYHVTSYDQRGGITAGIVNVGPAERHLRDHDLTELHEFVAKFPGTLVHRVTVPMGDDEASAFGNELAQFLSEAGWIVGRFAHVMGQPPLIPGVSVCIPGPDPGSHPALFGFSQRLSRLRIHTLVVLGCDEPEIKVGRKK